jgi:hypothetical protein
MGLNFSHRNQLKEKRPYHGTACQSNSIIPWYHKEYCVCQFIFFTKNLHVRELTLWPTDDKESVLCTEHVATIDVG